MTVTVITRIILISCEKEIYFISYLFY